MDYYTVIKVNNGSTTVTGNVGFTPIYFGSVDITIYVDNLTTNTTDATKTITISGGYDPPF